MTSLARADERKTAFEDMTEPLPSSVFHSRGELLWKVKDYLDRSQTDPNARGELYDYLRAQLIYRRAGYEEKSKTYSGYLYPASDSPVDERERVFRAAWSDLAKAILVAAGRLWRDFFLPDATNEAAKERFRAMRVEETKSERAQGEVYRFQLICQQSHTLMHLWLQASLYQVRAMRNVHSSDMILRPRKRKERIEGRLEEVIEDYFKHLANWENEIKTVTGLDFFDLRYGDVQWFRALSKEFGPSAVHSEETGWITFASDASTALRYQYFDARRRENWKTHHRLSALIQWLFGVTTGYGTRPMLFLRTALVLWFASAIAFFINDVLIGSDVIDLWNDPSGAVCPSSHPQIHQWTDLLTKLPALLTSFLQDLYIAATTLATMGNNSAVAAYCTGLSTQVVLTLTVFSGYFMLGLLSALLYTQLTEKD